MKKYIIEDARTGISVGGPMGGHVVVEARVRMARNRIMYYGIVEADGSANFFGSDTSIYDREIAEDYDENTDFPALEDVGDYDDFAEQYPELLEEDEGYALLLRYLVCLAQLDWDQVNQLKQISIGKAIGSFELPDYDIDCDQDEDPDEEN